MAKVFAGTSTPHIRILRRQGANSVASLVANGSDCFQKYIHMKVVKRMEGFRVRHVSDTRERRLLLPFSGSVSSITLLHVLDIYLRSQRERTGRTGFILHILLILDDSNNKQNAKSLPAYHDSIKSKYQDHQFSEVSLGELLSAKPFTQGVKGFAADRYLTGNLPPTARADLRSLFERLAVIGFASNNGCECILWPHSTTELARLILSGIAKGEGAFVGQLIADGVSPYAINFHYPMRHLSDMELELFVKMISLQNGFFDINIIGKETAERITDSTIDSVMLNCCTSTEKNYPNILANVVRTCGKLQVASNPTSTIRCTLCTALTETIPFALPHNHPTLSEGDSELQVVGLCCGCVRIVTEAST